ncbi:MAG: hypothetical protein K0S32_3374 [Bacteroidetes bacterium]|jgi:hypothetical protein|nr:hypothetical protein [Bacteroidota bacterium]
MAIRGKVKEIKVETMGKMTGTVTDTANKVDYYFEQPFGAELGLGINSIVQFETVTVADRTIGVSLDPVERASIDSIDYANNSGVIIDKVGNKIDFEQNYAKELGLDKGIMVKFAMVTVDGKMKATSLKVATNQ